MFLKVKRQNFTESSLSVCSFSNCEDGGDGFDARSDLSK